MAAKGASKVKYHVHPTIPYAKAIIENLKSKTGRTADEWAALIIAEGPKGDKERREWLKKNHKLGGTTANLVCEHAAGRSEENTSEEYYLRHAPKYVDELYAGKESLRPIHDELIELCRALGDDVKISPCQTMVPLYREHVFAQIKPTTKTRVDFGLALKDAKGKLPARLIDTGGLKKGDRITHRFGISSVGEIDDEVRKWLKIAYDLDA